MRVRVYLFVILLLSSFLLFAQDSNLKVHKIAEGFYNIRVSFMNFDSNILVLEGEDGILLVDAGYDVTSEEVAAAVRSISEKPVRYIVNTHAHMDHFGGNARMGKGATLIVHEDSRAEITGEYYSLGPNPRYNLPVISFQKELELHVYGQEIKIFTLNGHTGNDVVVHFPEAGILCAGGLIYSHQFPIIDRGRGGELEDMIGSIKYLNENISDDTVIIPSHGDKYTKTDLGEHYEMLTTTSEIIRKEIEAGLTPEEMTEKDILKDWEGWNGAFVNKDSWIRMVNGSILKTELTSVVSISDPLSMTIVNSGVEKAIEQYKLLQKVDPDGYNFSENEINMLGYNLMYRSMYDEAEKIFKLNIELFPESANTYDSLGELYMTLGKEEPAIEYYLRSLELNPENTNAEIMIERIKGKNE